MILRKLKSYPTFCNGLFSKMFLKISCALNDIKFTWETFAACLCTVTALNKVHSSS